MNIVFSDLDGTILDHNSYSYEESLEGINILKKRDVPLVLVSSKTFPEMKELYSELGLNGPFIFENGGGIAWPQPGIIDREFRIELLGKNPVYLRKKKYRLEQALCQEIMFLADMNTEEIVSRTGLTRKRAELAKKRLASLPFVFPGQKKSGIEEIKRINSIISSDGISITKGGRFFHLFSEGTGKGNAVRRIIDSYASGSDDSVISIGVGDSENDIAMLESVDSAFLVRKHDGTVINSGITGIRIMQGKGPAGFSQAMREQFNEDRI